MKNQMKKVWQLGFAVILGSGSFAAFADVAEVKTLDDLLQRVRIDANQDRSDLKAREAEFLAKKNDQKRLLDLAKRDLNEQEAITARLQKDFEANEKEITELEGKLAVVMGTLGELFGVVKQVAGDVKSQFENSIISAQFPGREILPGELAARKTLPSSEELERFWFLLQQEMTETGKVSQFQGEVVTTKGERVKQKISRVGAFNLVANEKYLVYQPETKQVTELARQPESSYLSMVGDLDEAKAGQILPFGLDPTRGALLSMLIQTPTFLERVDQGGLVGYIILVILFFGVALVVERYVVLRKQEKLVNEQLASEKPLENNPLGYVMKVYEDNKAKDTETLELKLDEAIMKVIPVFQRNIATIKVIVAVGPLLGLLGTVTGMIGTFQAITLFGTGDPKIMAGGISEALVTTVEGLITAIPLLLAHNFISSKAKNLEAIIEEQAIGMMAQKSPNLTTSSALKR